MKTKKNLLNLSFLIATLCMSLPLSSPLSAQPEEVPATTEETQQQTAPAEEQPPAPAPVEQESVWDFLQKGGITMFGLALISTLILAFSLERAFFFKQQNLAFKGVYEKIHASLRDGGIAAVESLVKSESSLLFRVLAAGLAVKNEGRERVERTLEATASIELGKLEKGLNLLSNLGNLAPLLGFFGTVTGMRHSFLQFVEKAAPTAKDLAGGVEEALITTIAGLFIAIPAYMIYNIFIYYIDTVTVELEKCSNEIISNIEE